jgi:hypothetical protein
MTAFTLKIIALAAMIIDHAAIVFPHHIPLEFRAVGRLAWPIFAYLLAEGFRHTKDPRKFMVRLGVLALISQIPYSLAITWAGRHDYIPWTEAISFASFINNTNIFYTLFLGGAAIMLFRRLEAKGYRTLAYIGAILPAALLAELLTADYGGMGVLFIFVMYVIAEKRKRLAAMAVLGLSQFFPLVMLYLAGNMGAFQISITQRGAAAIVLMITFTLFSVVLTAFYNGKRGRDMKWLFYAAYPVHLAVLAVAAILV